MMNRSTFFIFLLLAFLAIVGIAEAATPGAPRAVVIQTTDVQFFPSPPGSFATNATLTWLVSADDPDQLNGSLNYTIWTNNTPNPATSCASTGYPGGWVPIYNAAHTAITGRPGWVSTPLLPYVTGPGCGLQYVYQTNLTAALPGSVSAPSCVVAVDASVRNAHDQCGSTAVDPPTGLLAFVNATHQEPSPTPGNVNVSWSLSPDDENRTVGNLTYRIVLNTLRADGTVVELINTTDPTTAADTGGVRQLDFETAGQFQAQFLVRAEDVGKTLWWSNWTCSVQVNTQQIFAASGCGIYSGLSGGVPVTGPSFPLLNVPTWAASLGLSTTNAGFLLAGLLVFLLIIGGFALARGLGALVCGSIGFCAVAILGLVQLWAVVVVFILLAALTVAYFSRGAGGSA